MWRRVIVLGVVVACSDGPAPKMIPLPDAAVEHPACDAIGEVGCPAGQTCVFDYNMGSGTCLSKGKAALGAPCDLEYGSTGCADGMCRDGVCVALCDPFGPSSPCGGSMICSDRYDCSLASFQADAGAANHFCVGTESLQCDVSAGASHGRCISIYNANICRKECRVGVSSDCPSATLCAQPSIFGGSKLGVCMPALDQSTCVDGGTGTCAECVATEQGTGGCCATEAASCTTQACRDFVACAIACKRGRACVDACRATDATATGDGTPLFLCLSGYGAPPGGACGDVCNGLQVCGDFDGPDTASTCTACDPTVASCRANGCFNGFYCNRTTQMCAAPSSVPSCDN
jgi:hypothetical protein